MPLIYITGISGSGKSAVRAKLIKRGYEAHGTDEDGIANFHHNETNEIVDNPINAPPRTKEWRERRMNLKVCSDGSERLRKITLSSVPRWARLTTLHKLAKGLGVSTDTLFKGLQ